MFDDFSELFDDLNVYIECTGKASLMWAEEVLQAHTLQLLLQAEAIFNLEAWDLHSHFYLLHVVQPANQLLQVQAFLHLKSKHTNISLIQSYTCTFLAGLNTQYGQNYVKL